MADTAEAVKTIVPTGLEPTFTGALSISNTYQFANNGRMFLHIKNAGGSPDTVTIEANAKRGGLDTADRTVSVTNGQERVIGPFNPAIYNDGDGLLNFTHSFITSVTQGVFQL